MHSVGTPNNLKTPKDSEDKIFLAYYKRMEDRMNKFEQTLKNLENGSVKIPDCKEFRSDNKDNFNNINSMLDALNETTIKLSNSFENTTRALNLISQDLREHIIESRIYRENISGEISSLKIWRSFMTGGLTVLTALTLPLVVYIYLYGSK